MLDRQAVAVPPGDEGRAEAAHRLVAVDEIFEGFVERGADVDVAVGKGWAVVEDEGGAVGAFGLDRGIEAHFLPVGDATGLTLRETCAHGKVGSRKLESVF